MTPPPLTKTSKHGKNFRFVLRFPNRVRKFPSWVGWILPVLGNKLFVSFSFSKIHSFVHRHLFFEFYEWGARRELPQKGTKSTFGIPQVPSSVASEDGESFCRMIDGRMMGPSKGLFIRKFHSWTILFVHYFWIQKLFIASLSALGNPLSPSHSRSFAPKPRGNNVHSWFKFFRRFLR